MILSILDLPHTIYHGTISCYKDSFDNGIELNHNSVATDFGDGFYTTTQYHQAKHFAIKKAKIHNRSTRNHANPMIITLNLNTEKLNHDCHGIVFVRPDEKWREFILNNRVGKPFAISDFHNLNAQCDYVYGMVADAHIAQLTYSYIDKSISSQDFLNELIPLRDGRADQLSLHSINALQSITISDIQILKEEE